MSSNDVSAISSQRSEARIHFLQTAACTVSKGLAAAGSDAGMRSYWRLAEGILMDAPPADNDLAAWLDMQALLAAGGVRVPAILAVDRGQGFVLLEDLGHETMLERYQRTGTEPDFAAAIDQLLRLQAIAPPADLPDYDAALLQGELDLFHDWFLSTELGMTLDADQSAVWQDACHSLVEAALAQPTVLVHRDFMPRNLMPVDDGLAVIDFQDAVTGPVTYDNISLLKDAFASWPAERIEFWLRHYHERAGQAGLPVPDWPAFRCDIDLMGLQRHLKVIGIFARLKHRDRKPHYANDIPRFITYIDDVLPQHAELAPLQRLLHGHVWPAWHGKVNA